MIDALRGIGNALHTVACAGLMIDPRDLGRTLGSRSEGEGPPRKDPHAGVGFDPTIFLYDHIPGGVGLASRLYEQKEELLFRGRRLIEACPCEAGCPACIGPAIGTIGAPTPDVDLRERKRLALEVLSAIGIGGLQ